MTAEVVIGILQGVVLAVLGLFWNEVRYLRAKVDSLSKDLNRLIGACENCPDGPRGGSDAE